MKKKGINAQLDDLYDAVDCLFNNGSFEFVDDILADKTLQVWRMDLNILVGWATVTFPAKSKLPSRKRFIVEGMRFHPDPELWKGLE